MIDTQMHEILDDTKYAYVIGWSRLTAIADRVSVVAHQGNTISPGDRDWIHDRLRELSAQLDKFYDLLLPQPEEGDACDDADVRYSDGSAVFSATPSPDIATSHPKEATYCGDLGRGDDFSPGTLIIVEDPPHIKAWGVAGPQE